MSSSAPAVSRKRSESDRESSDLLTDVGGVSWARRAPISPWDQALSLGLQGTWVSASWALPAGALTHR